MDATGLEFLLREMAGFLDEPLHVALRRSQNAFITFEDGETGIERLQDVAQIGGGRCDPAIGSGRSFRHHAKRWNAEPPENGLEAEAEIRFRLGKPAQPDA